MDCTFRTFKIYKVVAMLFLVTLVWIASASLSLAATLSLSPATGVYTAGGTFTARVMVNTQGQSINAADATLSFNPKELSVVSVNRNGSIFNLWVTEPTFSNSAGTINFSGGLPSGYTGSSGNIMTVTFRAAGAGTARVNFTGGSVLANDGRGTNVLTSMNGGSYTIQAASVAPEPEVIEYVAPANTPAAPNVKSSTHPDSLAWYTKKTAELSWSIPSGVTSVRTLLNDNPTSVPTKVYENPIDSITIEDLDEGVSYFHIQFKNADGWGRVTHYRLAVDSVNPTNIEISHPEDADLASPIQTLLVKVEDETSEVSTYKVKIDSEEPYDFSDEEGRGEIALPSLEPGYHSVIIEAFDRAGNSIIGTHSFTILSFDKPVFTEYPNQIGEEVIPVIKGQTRPNSEVEVSFTKIGTEPKVYMVNSDENGEFIFIPEGTLSSGVYELYAVAKDKFGAKSEMSDVVRIAVQQPGYLRIGNFIVSVFSVIVPLVLMLFALLFGVWYLFAYFRRFRKRVDVESREALQILHKEFSVLGQIIDVQESNMIDSRKTKKLTKAEAEMLEVFRSALSSSKDKVQKEINDVAELTNKNSK